MGSDPREESEEALRRLEERIERASQAAERLVAHATEQARHARARKPPAAGWQTPPQEHEGGRGRSEIELLTQILESLRDLIPPELERRLAEALRELLLAVRALIDWYLERSERKRSEPTEVQDIPIL
ncbi:MAG: hypothetical protein JOZ73_10555 [Solirubrobacterales bacterium]|nr:hypothetical protein [Solirubrobacterales bacterium]